MHRFWGNLSCWVNIDTLTVDENWGNEFTRKLLRTYNFRSQYPKWKHLCVIICKLECIEKYVFKNTERRTGYSKMWDKSENENVWWVEWRVPWCGWICHDTNVTDGFMKGDCGLLNVTLEKGLKWKYIRVWGPHFQLIYTYWHVLWSGSHELFLFLWSTLFILFSSASVPRSHGRRDKLVSWTLPLSI